MEASLELPTATSFRDLDVTVLWNARAALNAELKARGVRLSFTHLVGWAIVRSAAEYPVMTHAVRTEGDQYVRFDPEGVHLGLAVDGEGRDGRRKLLVPVIKGTQAMSFAEFHAEYERLVAGARDGKLMPEAYMGGTITLTNPGTLGTMASVPRLMKGQGSIVATGAIRELAGRRLMTITSTITGSSRERSRACSCSGSTPCCRTRSFSRASRTRSARQRLRPSNPLPRLHRSPPGRSGSRGATCCIT